VLKAASTSYSMIRKGDCLDDALAEGFFATPAIKALRPFEFNTHEAGRDKVLRYISWYDTHSRRSTLGLLSPATFQTQTRTVTCAA
jgi:putative transposase